MPDNADRPHASASNLRASPERLVAGRYRLLRELGRGGMGVVWLAEDTALGRYVAVKELRPPPGLSEVEREALRLRAQQEARSAARIHHPNAIILHEAVPATEQDDALYLIMEFVEGPTLGQLVAAEGPLPAPRVAVIGLQLLDVLAAAHALGIVHRDVKPGNILISAGDWVKLTDFGIAYRIGGPRLTRSGVMGTQAYQAPELFESVPITPAVDLWSLGATLYHAADGHGPFDRDSTGATLRAIVLDELPVPGCDERLAVAITGLLQRNPAERATIDQAGALLRQVRGVPAAFASRPVQPVPQPPPTSGPVKPRRWDPDAETGLRKDAPPPVASATVPPQDPPPGGRSRRVAAIIAAAILVAAAAATGGVLGARSSTGSAGVAATHSAGTGSASASVPATGTAAPPSIPRTTLPFSEQPSGQMVVFANSSGQIRYDTYVSGWHGPDVLPGRPRADSPIVDSPDTGNVFFVASNGDVVNDYDVSGVGWEGPGGIGGTAEAGSGLAFFPGNGPGTIPDVVFVNTSGKLVYDYYTSSWHGPDVLPGTPRPDSPIVDSPDGDHVFFIEPDGSVVNDYYLSGWKGPDPIGGTAGPGSGLAFSAGASSAGTLPAVAFVNTSGKLVYDSSAPDWTGPDPLPGSPRAGSQVAWAGDGTSVYFIASDGQVATDYRSGSGSGWQGPSLTGGTAAGGSGLDYAPGSGTTASRPNLIFIDSDGVLVDDWYANGWHGPGPLPGSAG